MKIAILSNGNVNYSTLRLKEEAEKRDHIVKIIKYRKCYVTIDEKNPTVMYGGQALDQYDAIIPRIASNMTRYGTAVARQLEMAYPRTLFVNRSIAITR
ncbi:MAG: 30S ribosomal protein S6--L-glutamate ligase, partial [Candidatus Saccharimonas sp.]